MRTVGTRLTAEVSGYVNPVRESKRETRGLVDELQEAARKGDLTATAIGTIGTTSTRSLGMSERAAARLEDQIAETAREVQRLDAEFRKTGDLTLFGDLEKQLVKLKGQLKARDEFSGIGKRVGESLVEDIGVVFSQRIGPVLARAPLNLGAMGPVGAGIGAVVAAGASSIIGSAVAGAVVGGAGIGGVVGGIALAARDPRVKAEGKALGQEFLSMLEDSAQHAFVPVTRQAIAFLRNEIDSIEPFLRRIFAEAAAFVEPLTRGFTGLVKYTLPGVLSLIERARPVIDVIADRLPEVGDAISDALEDISGDANAAAAGVDTILNGLISIIRFGGNIIAFFMDMFRVVVMVADAALSVEEALLGWNPALSWRLEDGRENLDRLKSILDGTASSADDTAEGFGELADSAGRTAEEVEALKTAFDDLFGIQMNVDQATIAYKDGLAELKDELADGKRTLDLSTQAGRDNAAAVLDQIDRIKTLRDATYEQTGSIDTANAAYGRQLTALRKTLLQMGYTKEEVDALIGKYRQIPDKVSTDVNVTGNAVSRADAIREAINRIPREVFATVYVNRMDKGRQNRWGGLYEHAEVGLLREAAIASPVAPARYAWAEPATGGEAFIPRYGNLGRSRDIWEYVGQHWLGMLPRPRGGDGASAAAPTYNTTNTVNLYGSEATPERYAAWHREQQVRERVGRPR